MSKKDDFLKSLRTGCSRATAARAARLSIDDVNRWCLEAKSLSGSDEHVAFVHELERVEAQLELLCHATVIKNAQTNPKWAAWWIGHKRRSYNPTPPAVLPDEVLLLKDKRQQFVLNFVCGPTRGNTSASYRAAGYSHRTSGPSSGRLMSSPEVQVAINALTDAMRSTILTSDVLDGAERERICAELARDPEYPPGARLAAVRLSAELTGGFNQWVE